MSIETLQEERTSKSTAMKLTNELDLQPISYKLNHVDPELWDNERLSAIEQDYRRFLALHLMYPYRTFVPTILLDTYWHTHILDTRKYAVDCDRVFGYFLHHDPYFGLADDAEKRANHEMFEATCEIWKKEFGTTLRGRANPCASTDCR